MQPTSAKLKRKLNLPSYLTELAALTGRSVGVDELGSAEQAATLREAAKGLATQSVTSSEIPFADRTSERFRAFVQRLSAASSSPIYVWTPRTIDCGVLVVPSLAVIRFDFDFTINADGMLSFLTTDLTDRLLLDFFVSADHQCIKVETQGMNWAQVAY